MQGRTVSKKDAPTRAPAQDLRDWLDRVEALGELKHVRNAHWNLELGCISEINSRQRGPCLLFDDIVDYPSGFRVVTGTTGTPARLAATLRLPTNLSTPELVGMLRKKSPEWSARANDFPPQYVDSGPILENIKTGNQVNLLEFPAPMWNEGDGGRYMGTGDAVITQDPESGWVNVGTYRLMVHDQRTTGLYLAPNHHGRLHMEKYWQAGKPFPVVASVGHDPLLFLYAGVELPVGMSEYNYIGAVMGEPAKVVRGELTGLPMPAGSEIVLEGFCRPGNIKRDGPFGEFLGYYSANDVPQPVFEVERIYHRNNPIILGSPPGRPPHDYAYSKTVIRSALLHDALEKAGMTGIVSCWADEVGGGRALLVISVRQQYQGHGRQVGLMASQCPVGYWMGRYVIVVDDDIDPSNLTDVMWAVSTRCEPARDIQILERLFGTKIDAINTTMDQDVPYLSRAVIDACRTYEYRDAFPPVAEASPELQRQIREKWKDLLGTKK
ncbi:MAG: UbiD family decarboxylase [Betaproteobacteria bacterium]|nr:UbiD family decarboxylase [Betaproteobacteria bacterium]